MLDDTWRPVKKYITRKRKQVYYEEYDPIALKKLIETQHKVIDLQKKNKQKDLSSILIVVNDFADDPKFVRYSSILHGLFTRGRHNAISCILSTQKCNVLAPVIRLNAGALFIFRLKNMNEVNSFLEENSALVDKKKLYLLLLAELLPKGQVICTPPSRPIPFQPQCPVIP